MPITRKVQKDNSLTGEVQRLCKTRHAGDMESDVATRCIPRSLNPPVKTQSSESQAQRNSFPAGFKHSRPLGLINASGVLSAGPVRNSYGEAVNVRSGIGFAKVVES